MSKLKDKARVNKNRVHVHCIWKNTPILLDSIKVHMFVGFIQAFLKCVCKF